MFILNTILSDFDKTVISFVTNQITKKLTKIENIEYIDVGFVLRILLEFYRSERIQKLILIRKLFQAFAKLAYGNWSRNNVKFTEFKEIMEEISPGTTNLVFLSLLKKIFYKIFLNFKNV